jgi:hypothetical protein
MQWVLVLLVVVGIELCLINAFAFPKAVYALLVLIEELVGLIGLPTGKPFRQSRLRCGIFHLRRPAMASLRSTIGRVPLIKSKLPVCELST